MECIEKIEPILIFSSIILGLLFSNIAFISDNSSILINFFLFLMLLGVFLEIPLNDLKNGFKNFKFTKTSILINFIFTPIFGYFLGSIFLYNHLDIWIGFVMLILTPCTDWYLLFTKIAKGNLSLSLSILPINLILQVILLPIYLILFFSSSNTINLSDLGFSLFILIILPFLLSIIIKFLFKNKISIKNKIDSFFSKSQVIFLSLAIFIIFSSEANVLFENVSSIFLIFIPLIIFFIVIFILDYIVSKKVSFSYDEYASLTLTTLARNSPLALAIAINSFPHRELIIIALVIGPLIELPVLYIISKGLLKIKRPY
ncbi:arsenic resistance protein [Methanobrevibacter sp. DSM 116169]|uniref:arsenic resistance protein n=1 Tax=Methanobrevibacter sp. DSM 116169 TaxID=3242727 RepID=UPI0038FC98CD